MPFKLIAPYEPRGDQPKAIKQLVDGLKKGYRYQTLLGVTGSGKTFTMANVIQKWGRPTLILSPNKVLAVQLYREFRDFFPENAVELFISYYDYYQPEAYIPATDTYIPKDSSINEQIDKMRLSAISSLVSREDVIVVASVSAIYSLDNPIKFRRYTVPVSVGKEIDMRSFSRRMVKMGYEREHVSLTPGKFRIKGEIIEVYPPTAEGIIRIYVDEDIVERIVEVDPITHEVTFKYHSYTFLPATYYVREVEEMENIVKKIEKEMKERVEWFKKQGKIVEAQRLEQITRSDMEMLLTTGWCKGIENYSMYLTGRKPGERPFTLLDYFPDDFLLFIDESHLAVPQLRGMYHGDISRKKTLIEYGWRLPSAIENRPLKPEEFWQLVDKVIFVSATPGDFELEVSDQVVEQIVRPTGLLDPEVEIRPATGQVNDILKEAASVAEKGERVIVTTVTKKLAEEVAQYFTSLGVKARYMHHDIDTIERAKILRQFREGVFSVLVGINLLREGLDLPEVTLVAVLDADKEGFLRSYRSLIQVMGRAARNVLGRVILYADEITPSIDKAVKETRRRRKIQEEYNKRYGITPQTIQKKIEDFLDFLEGEKPISSYEAMSDEELRDFISLWESKMYEYAENLEFEKAIEYRDKIERIKALLKRRHRV